MFFDDNTELEKILVANTLVFPKTIPDVLTVISPDDIEDKSLRDAFSEITSQFLTNGTVDAITLVKTPVPLRSELLCVASTAAFTKTYAKKVLQSSLLRKAVSFAEDVKSRSDDGKADIDGYLAYISQAASLLNEDRRVENEYQAATLTAMTREESKNNADKDSIGTPTGIRELDVVTSGIQRGHFWVIGAYTSVGKTAFATQIMVNMLLDGKHCVMLSNEMTALQITYRMLGILSGVPALKIQHGKMLSPHEYTAVETAYRDISKMKFTIAESMNEREKVLATVRKHAGADCIFIDYLGQISSEERSEYEQMTRISREIQATAMQNKVPIIALSQVSNESAKTTTQVLGFKGSGNVAAAADVGIELHRDKENQPDVLKINVRKNRHGATATIDALFDIKTGRITQQRRME